MWAPQRTMLIALLKTTHTRGYQFPGMDTTSRWLHPSGRAHMHPTPCCSLSCGPAHRPWQTVLAGHMAVRPSSIKHPRSETGMHSLAHAAKPRADRNMRRIPHQRSCMQHDTDPCPTERHGSQFGGPTTAPPPHGNSFRILSPGLSGAGWKMSQPRRPEP